MRTERFIRWNTAIRIQAAVFHVLPLLKTIALLALFLMLVRTSMAQSPFNTEADVLKFMEGKKFVRSDLGFEVVISYGYISSLNDSGFIFITRKNNPSYVTNCKFIPHGHYCDIYVDTGRKKRYQLYSDRLVIFDELNSSSYNRSYYLSDK